MTDELEPFDFDAESIDDEPGTIGRPVDPPDERRPFYASVSSRPEHRRPIVPAALRSRDQRSQLYRWATRYGAHTAAYHVTRSPKYAGKVTFWAPWGLVRAVSRLIVWATAEQGNWSLRQSAANSNDPDTWLRLDHRRMLQSRWRWWVVAAVILAVGLTVTVLLSGLPPWWARWVALAVAVPVLARLGRPEDKPIVDRVYTGAKYRRLTAELTRMALLATGYGKEPKDFQFPRDIGRDGPGYSALVDLPRGVTAAMVVDRRDRAAGALKLPLDQVWLRPGRHAGQVELWVADDPISQTRQPDWPLLRHGRADIFRELPLGTDERGNLIAVVLMFTNLVIGAIPRMGKTFVLRLVLLAAALDPRVEVWAADMKGTGDLGPLEPVAHRYFVGDDDDEILNLLDSLRDLVAELRRRAKVIRSLPRSICPESKVTPDLAANRQLRLHPIVVGIDECQVLFTHEEHGREFEKLCTDLIKRGPAMGIILVLATQRPDAKSLPTGISGNAGMRFCLRVMGQQENDMVLGTSMYRNGIRATQFTKADRGMGWLVGALDEPTITRAFYVDGPMADRIVTRAVALREGTDMIPETPQRREQQDVLADVLRVFAHLGRPGLSWRTLAELMAGNFPETYAGLTAEAISARVRAENVPSRDIKESGVALKGCKRADIEAAIQRRELGRGRGAEPSLNAENAESEGAI